MEQGRILHTCTHTLILPRCVFHSFTVLHTHIQKCPIPIPPLQRIQILTPCYVRLPGSFRRGDIITSERQGEEGRRKIFWECHYCLMLLCKVNSKETLMIGSHISSLQLLSNCNYINSSRHFGPFMKHETGDCVTRIKAITHSSF